MAYRMAEAVMDIAAPLFWATLLLAFNDRRARIELVSLITGRGSPANT
jgi:hypothetical protein